MYVQFDNFTTWNFYKLISTLKLLEKKLKYLDK